MTALIIRDLAIDALARSKYERFDSHFTMPNGFSWDAYKADDPDGARMYLSDAGDDLDALLASGAVIDAAALADDEALMRAWARAEYGGLFSDQAQAAGANLLRRFARSLAAALSDREATR